MLWFGTPCRVAALRDAIEEQERVERLGMKRAATPPETSPEERYAMERVYAGCLTERDRAISRLRMKELLVFEHWRGGSPGIREAGKAILADRR